MQRVMCPICNKEITGADADQLSASLKDHASSQHQKEIESALKMMPRSGGARPVESERKLEEVRELRSIPPEGRSKESEKLEEEVYHLRSPEAEKTLESKRVTEEVTRLRSENMVAGPICDAPLEGRTVDILSERLRDHLTNVHQVQTTVLAR